MFDMARRGRTWPETGSVHSRPFTCQVGVAEVGGPPPCSPERLRCGPGSAPAPGWVVAQISVLILASWCSGSGRGSARVPDWACAQTSISISAIAPAGDGLPGAHPDECAREPAADPWTADSSGPGAGKSAHSDGCARESAAVPWTADSSGRGAEKECSSGRMCSRWLVERGRLHIRPDGWVIRRRVSRRPSRKPRTRGRSGPHRHRS